MGKKEKISKKELILQGDIYKAIVILSFPIMINNLIQTLYNLADGIWVSRLGHVQFAATSFVWPVNFLFISIGFGLSIAATSILSQLIGADRIEDANEYASQIIGVSMVISIILAIVGYNLTPQIIKFMGASGDLKKYSTIYLRLTFIEIPFMFLFFNFNSIMNAEGNTVTPTKLSAISAIMNVVLDPLFIFGWKFIPAMGIAGAAVATIISRAVLSIIGIFVIAKKDTVVKPSFKNFRFNRPMLNNILKVALPSSLGQSGSAMGFIILNKFIASYGDETIAAYGMVNRITSLIMQPAGGIGAALTSIVGQNIGAKQYQRVKDGFRKAIKFTVILGVLGGILLIVNDERVIGFFMGKSRNMEVFNQGIEYLKFSAAFTPLMGIFSVFQGVFQGSGHTKHSMIMEIGRLWFVRLPMILIFKHFSNLGPTGIWIAMSVSNLIVCLYGLYIYKKGDWMRNVVAS